MFFSSNHNGTTTYIVVVFFFLISQKRSFDKIPQFVGNFFQSSKKVEKTHSYSLNWHLKSGEKLNPHTTFLKSIIHSNRAKKFMKKQTVFDKEFFGVFCILNIFQERKGGGPAKNFFFFVKKNSCKFVELGFKKIGNNQLFFFVNSKKGWVVKGGVRISKRRMILAVFRMYVSYYFIVLMEPSRGRGHFFFFFQVTYEYYVHNCIYDVRQGCIFDFSTFKA